MDNRYTFSFIFLIMFMETEATNDTLFQHLHRELFHRKYNKKVRPNFGSGPVNISVSIHITSLGSISEVTMSYDADIYLREEWRDSRLDFEPEVFDDKSKLSLHDDFAQLLWLPDTFLPNSMENGAKTSSESTTHKKFVTLRQNGYLLQSKRLAIRTECPMDLTFYPFDRQICRISVASYGHDYDDIMYTWSKTNSVTINPELELPEFKLTRVVTKQRLRRFSTGNFSGLELCIYFERRPGYFVISMYFPASIIVVISWVSLWLSNESTLSDIIQVILAVIFLNFTQNSVMPKVSYVKAIDFYMGMCFFVVFLSLVKLSIYKYLQNKNKRLILDGIVECDVVVDEIGKQQKTKNLLQTKEDESTGIKIFNMINKKCFYLLPVLFTCFSVFYFIGYFILDNAATSTRCEFD